MSLVKLTNCLNIPFYNNKPKDHSCKQTGSMIETQLTHGSSGQQKITPKVLLIAMVCNTHLRNSSWSNYHQFYEESRNWLSSSSAIQFPRKIRVPGLARGYENIHVTENGDVALLVVGTARKTLSQPTNP